MGKERNKKKREKIEKREKEEEKGFPRLFSLTVNSPRWLTVS